MRGDSVAEPFLFEPTTRVTKNKQKNGELAQLGERLVCNQEVTGSSPVFSTRLRQDGASRRPRHAAIRKDEGGSLTTEYPANGSSFRTIYTRSVYQIEEGAVADNARDTCLGSVSVSSDTCGQATKGVR